MRKYLLLFLLIVALGSGYQAAASDRSDAAKESGSKKAKGPRLVLTVYPRQGFMPLHVSVNAELEGVDEKNAEYYCLREEWDFGDGSVSSEQPNCETFTEDTKVTLHFFAEHVYSDEGNYVIKFSLGNPVKIRGNPVSINVLEREMGR